MTGKKLEQKIDLIKWQHLGKAKLDIILKVVLPVYDEKYIDYVRREVLHRLDKKCKTFTTEWTRGKENISIEVLGKETK